YSGFRTDGDYEFARVGRKFEDGPSLPLPTASATRINNKRERHDGHLSVGVDLATHGYLLGQQIVGYSTGGEPGLDRPIASATAGQQRFAEQDVLRSISQLRWEALELPGPTGSLELSLSHRLEDSKFRDPVPALEAQAIDDHFLDQSTALAIDPEWNVFGFTADHRIRAQLRLARDAFDASDARARERYGFALALRDDAQWFGERLVLSPGVRLDWTDQSGSQVLPGVGFVAAAFPWLRFKGNVARAFRNPAFEELYLPDRGFLSGNPDLDPERATHYDVGIELQFARVFFVRDLHLAASVFRSDVDESIIWVPVSPYKIRPENSGDSVLEGIEVSTSFALGHYVSVFANHTELRAEVVPQKVRLPGRAERETSVRLELGDGGWWKAAGEFQRTGSIVVSWSGNYILPRREVWNASLALDLAQLASFAGFDAGMRALWLSAAVYNIGNIAIRDSVGFPQPGRTLRAGVEARW
ncbi:MAG: TonB-dependent receptor, partial [bacterium]|nr:TonB-dependent receptor [bacterium]